MGGLVAITRAVGPALAACELTFLAREPIDLAKAAGQHEAYCDALREAGIAVTVLPAEPALPDSVFVEDAAIVLDEIAVLTRPGAASRRPEVASVAEALAGYRPRARIEAPGTLDGGDLLRVGRRLFAGLSSRSNEAGLARLASIIEPFGYAITRVAVQGCLHLKTAVTALSEDTVLVNPRWIDAHAFDLFRQIRVAEGEPLAANALTLGGVVHLSTRWPRTRALLEGRGFRTRALDLSEFEKAEAGLTCLSLVFPAAARRE